MNGHKDPNDNHDYHDENHDEIEFYEGIRNRSTYWHSTPEQRTPQKQSYRLKEMDISYIGGIISSYTIMTQLGTPFLIWFARLIKKSKQSTHG